MGNEWLDDAINSATGNIVTYEEYEASLFEVFQKFQDNGYPDNIIVSMTCDFTKMPMTIPALFDEWRSQQ